MKRIGLVNLILAIGVFAVMAPQYGTVQALVLALLVLVVLVGYDRLARRFLTARRYHDKDPDRYR